MRHTTVEPTGIILGATRLQDGITGRSFTIGLDADGRTLVAVPVDPPPPPATRYRDRTQLAHLRARHGDTFRLDHKTWVRVCWVAFAGGWRPAASCYFAFGGELVAPRDAKAIAAGLRAVVARWDAEHPRPGVDVVAVPPVLVVDVAAGGSVGHRSLDVDVWREVRAGMKGVDGVNDPTEWLALATFLERSGGAAVHDGWPPPSVLGSPTAPVGA